MRNTEADLCFQSLIEPACFDIKDSISDTAKQERPRKGSFLFGGERERDESGRWPSPLRGRRQSRRSSPLTRLVEPN